MATAPWGNYQDRVIDQIEQHPDIDLGGEDDVRGRLVDAVAIDLNGGTTQGPWGRKAREANGGRRNGDGLTYQRPDGRFEIVDILKGLERKDGIYEPGFDRRKFADWAHKGTFAPGENGYWTAASPIEPGGGTVDPPPAGDDRMTNEQIRATIAASCRPLLERIETLERDTIRYGMGIGLRAHNGQNLSAEEGGPRSANERFVLTSRMWTYSWETWTITRPGDTGA